MYHHNSTFSTLDGLELYSQTWQPDRPVSPKINLILVHGLGTHSDVFHNMIDYLVDRHYALWSYDQRGNGRSPGRRGYINNWAELRTDLAQFVRSVQAQSPHLPCFLFGHSLGAVVVLDYILQTSDLPPIDGIILSAAALQIDSIAPWRIFLSNLLSRIQPHFTLTTGIDREAASRDPAVPIRYAQDAMRHSNVSARMGTEFFRTTRQVWQQLDRLHTPILILHGESDRVTSPQASRDLYRAIAFENKLYHEYVDGYHDIYDDINYLEMLADIDSWMVQQVHASSKV
jgi:alpha-beta hydrolase superfamily lysophospholipase